MNGYVSFPGGRRIQRFLASAANLAAIMPEVMEDVEKTIVEDNRKGVLAGKQCDDSGMPPVSYRGGMTRRTAGRRVGFGTKSGRYKGPATVLGGLRTAKTPGNGNLATAEYRKLKGPPLAPRGDESRVIANLFTEHYQAGDVWIAQGKWFGVVSGKGVGFLKFHFRGIGQKRRDLRGVRAWGRGEARRRARRTLRDYLRTWSG